MRLEHVPARYEAFRTESPDLSLCRVASREKGCVLPRTSVFLRKAAGVAVSEQVVAANIDAVFLCMSLNNDFNLRRLERYLAIA